MKTSLIKTTPDIVHSYYESSQIANEECIPEHGISYIISGSLRVVEKGESQVFSEGSLLFYRKNCLAKFIK